MTNEMQDDSELFKVLFCTATMAESTRATLLAGCRGVPTVGSPEFLHQPFLCDSPRLPEMETGWMSVSDVLAELPSISQEIAPRYVRGADCEPRPANLSFVDPSVPVTLSLGAVKNSTTPASSRSRSTTRRAPNSQNRNAGTTGDKNLTVFPVTSKTRGVKRNRKEAKEKQATRSNSMSSGAAADQIVHVLRERQRRDDMSSKIRILEGLLPPVSKRDRASIVHDTVQYVKNLQQRVQKLRITLGTLKNPSDGKREAGDVSLRPEFRPNLLLLPGAVAEKCVAPAKERARKLAMERTLPCVELYVRIEGSGEAIKISKQKCRPNYLSVLMRTLEQLHLELCRCSVTKMLDYVMCIIVAKPMPCTLPKSSAAVAVTLKAALDP